MPQKISREEEATIPQFHSHEEAKKWFKDKYGADFCLEGIDNVGDQVCFFYILVLDWQEYMNGRRSLEGNAITTMDFLSSHQSIQIMQDGGVHIVH